MTPAGPSTGDPTPPPRLRLVTGSPPERRATLLRIVLAAAPADAESWWLTDTPAAAAAIRRRLASAERPGWLGLRVLTVRQAAGRLAASSPLLPLGPAARQALLAELAAVAGHREALGPLEPLIGSPGLTEFLASRFRQLRRQGVSAGAAASALRESDGEEAGGVLARLYRDYLTAIERGDLLDDEETVLVATQLADASNTPRLLVLDLPQSVTPIEQRLLAALSRHASEVVAAVAGPVEDAPAAGQLAAARVLSDRWRETVGVDRAERVPPGPDAPPLPAGLSRLRERLFDDDAMRDGDPAGVRLLVGSGAHDTARRVAARVKRLLADGARPAEVVLAVPMLDTAAPRYAEALREYGVPAAVDASARLGTASVVPTAIDLLETKTSGWAYEALLSLVSRQGLRAFSERGPGEGFGTVRAGVEWLVRRLQVPSGDDYLIHQAEQLAAREEPTAGVRRLAAAASAAAPALKRLKEVCDALPTEATPLEWLDATDAALRALGGLGLGPSADPDDRRAGDVLEEAAAAVESLARWRGREPRKLAARDWLALLRLWATRLRLPSSGAAEGRVRLVGLTTAPGLPCEHLVLCDAGESAFAPPDAASADEAMLHFYELCATPTRSLTFAYAALDNAAQPLSPSPYVVDVERLFPEGALRRGERPLLATIDPDAAPLSAREWRLHATAQTVAGDGGALAAYTRRHGGALPDALRAVDARARGDAFGPWEGVLPGEAAHRLLAERFGPEHLWSASQLELMATCPFKFFSRYALRMEPSGELALGVDYRRRGLLMHDALAECLKELKTELGAGQTLRSVPPDELTARLVAHIDAQVTAGKLPAHEAALARIEARQATEWAQRYADQQAKYEADRRWGDATMRPALLEARFGPKTHADGAEDPASVDTPLKLQLPGGETLHVTGRIDRVDTGALGDATLFTVVDYKTSKEYRVKVDAIASGKQLQPVLYALAAQRLLLGEGAIPVGAGYWVLQKNGFVAPPAKELPLVEFEDGVARPSGAWRDLVETVTQRCESLVAEVRGGQFPMVNDDEHCGQRCEFRTVCRVAQARALGKTSPAATEEDS